MKYTVADKELFRCLSTYPPDFEKAERLLTEGADINAFDDEVDPETILSELINEYPRRSEECLLPEGREVDCGECGYRKVCCSGEYIPKIVRFFLDHGYDVSKGEGMHGAVALSALCWSSSDKYILDAAKMLLDAGSDPLFDIDGDECSALDCVGWKEAGAVTIYGNLKNECLFTLLHDMMKAAAEKEPYAEMRWPDAVIGKRIDKIYSCADSPEKAVFDVQTGNHHYQNCFFEDIIMECGGLMLHISRYCHVFVNPYHLPPEESRTDLSPYLGMLIGKKIKDVQFLVRYREEERWAGKKSTAVILLEDGSALLIQDNADEEEETYCAYFTVTEKFERSLYRSKRFFF